MIELNVLQGLPASGKTTYARKWVGENPKNRVRVNRDDIRHMLGPYWVPQREDLVTTIENQMILDSALAGYSVVVDATNFRGLDRFKNLLNQFDGRHYPEVDIKLVNHFLNVDVKTCIQRDQQREQQVGKDVINRMYEKWLKS